MEGKGEGAPDGLLEGDSEGADEGADEGTGVLMVFEVGALVGASLTVFASIDTVGEYVGCKEGR